MRTTRARFFYAVMACTVLGATDARAQERPTLTPEEYGRWESLGAAQLSPDGEWAAYRVSRVNEENELRVLRLADDSTRVIAWGAAPEFSANSRWLVYEIGVSTEERERLEENDEPVRVDAGLLDLAGDGGERTFDDVSAFAFDAEGRFLALHGYAPESSDDGAADLRVLDLGAGTVTTFGNVSEFSWSDAGSRLAVAVTTSTGSGNSVQVYDASTGQLRALDTSPSTYQHLAWRKGAADLAVLRSREAATEEEDETADPAGEEGGEEEESDASAETDDEDADENDAHDVVAWRGLDSATPRTFVLAPGAAGIDDTLDIVEHAAPVWSEDGAMISLGLRPIEPAEEDTTETVAAPTPSEDEDETEDEPEDGAGADPDDEPELPGVQIWHSSDVRLFPQQKASESSDERRTLLAVWHLDDERVVRIGTDLLGSAELLDGWRHALEELNAPYAWGMMFGRPYRDVWVVDVETGEREMLLERVRYAWPSSGGRFVIAFDGENYTSHDLDTGTLHELTSGLDAVFADTAYDTPTDLLPPHDLGPWLEDDAAVFVYDEYDVWKLAPDGSEAARVTDGAGERIVHRVVSLADDDTPGLEADAPVYLSLHGEWSEKRGYARSMPDGALETLVFEDRNISGLMKADSADVYAYRRMAFDEPPSLLVAGPDLTDATPVTEINPFFSEVAWGRAQLVDFTSESGRPLQAVLYLPANYEEGTRVPTIVYTYEMRSPTIHTFEVPTERDYYNFTAWTQHGYAVLQPDIVYRARDPGISALESVRAAVARVVELGITDPDAVGLIGHSWGGYQATFLPTRTDIFAASVAGAPLTDFVSFMGAIHWNPGIAEVDHWETGQARMEVPFWEDPEAHRRNSPIHEVHRLETPMLMAFGDDDGVVDWDQGTEFYNFARRAGKQMVLLVYEGEDHGFSEKPNQIDYHRRILEWFGHYLKGEPAPAWITDGVKLEELEAEKKRVAKKGGG